MKVLNRHALMAALGIACTAAAYAQAEPQRLSSIRLNAGMHIIQAELASSPSERAIGLMHRKSMGNNEGMLFAFEAAAEQCFWMKNTLLPLSIAFLKDDGTVVNVEHMEAQTLDSHCSKEPVRFALEMNDGWFAKRGIKAGDRVQGVPFGR